MFNIDLAKIGLLSSTDSSHGICSIAPKICSLATHTAAMVASAYQEPKALTRSPRRGMGYNAAPMTRTGSHMRLVILALGLVVGSCSRDVPNMIWKAERTVQG
jgi:hypothetical protein